MLTALAACWTNSAQATAPRDAIRLLPTITHSSEFFASTSTTRALGGDSSPQQTSQETYFGRWDFDWNPGDLQLSGPVRLTPQFHYQTTSLDVVRGGGSDSTHDEYNFGLSLNAGGVLIASHGVRQARTLGPTPSGTGLDESTTQSNSINLRLPNDITASFSNSVDNHYNGLVGSELNGSTSEGSVVSMEYAPQAAMLSQRVKITAAKSHSFNYGQQSGNDSAINTVDAYRQFDFGSAGKLQLSLSQVEQNQKATFESEVSRTLDTSTGAVWFGSMPGYPLNYRAEIKNRAVSYSSQPGLDYAARSVHFDYRPPAQGARVFSLGLDSQYSQTRQLPNINSSQHNQLNWSFKLHDLVQSNLNYSTDTNVNEAAGELRSENEYVQGNLIYTQPGGRGQLQLELKQWNSQNGQDSFSSANTLTLNHSVKLDDRAQLNLGYEQIDSATGSGASEPSENNLARARVSYQINLQQLNVDATWLQELTISHPSAIKHQVDNVQVKLNFVPAPNWRYSLSLNSTDTSHRNLAEPGDNTYAAGNEVRAVVTYTF